MDQHGCSPAGVVVALCAGHRCTALTRRSGGGSSGDGSLAAAVTRSGQSVLITAPCLRQCAHGAVGAVALRSPGFDVTGPSLWLGGLDAPGRMAALSRWVEDWQPPEEGACPLPPELAGTVIGRGLPLRLA